jgi:hypothetical protein
LDTENGEIYYAKDDIDSLFTKNGNGNINVAMYGGINALIQVGKGNIQTRLLGGANVIVKVGDVY